MTHSMIELPGYQFLDQLHVGVKSLVYRGRRGADGQTVVIKVLRSDRPTPDELMQLQHQFAIARSLHGPNIVWPYELLPYRQSYALILEDFGGISLKHWMEQRWGEGQGGLGLLEFLEIAQQLANILKHLNDQGIIHKDIKPSNLLIHPETRQVKLTDFSLASRLPRQAILGQRHSMLEGTLAYISPEQTGRINRGVDYRTDYYSLGITLYELLAGRVPFTADTLMGLVYCHIAKAPPPIASVNPSVPAAVAAIVSRLMAKNPEDRYQSAAGLHHDLERCRHQLEQMGQIVSFDLGQRDRSHRFLIPEKLYGRGPAVAAVLAAFERVSTAGVTGSELVLVAGYSGVGKTAVVSEVQKPIARQQGYFIQGKFDQFKRNTPFMGFLTALQALMQQLLSESEAQLQAWRADILTALGANGQLLIDVIPELEQIIGPQPPVIELSGQAAQHRFNRLFQNFVQVFAAPQHPLVVFLDDLQWADLASLQLVNLLIGDLRCPHLLLIGAYRDNEVSPAHPLMLTLDTLRQGGATINTITLEPLSAMSINQLVADTLVCPVLLAQPLADLVYQKTGGNPFFATQFLQTLHQEGTIVFDPVQGAWQCDLGQARSAAINEDVVAFMAQQLQKLGPSTQAMLKLAACIGNPFNLGTLALVSELPETDVAIALWSALELGLVLPQSEIYTLFLPEGSLEPALLPSDRPELSYRFLHDRIQQAAYSLIPADQRSQTHLTIGQLLWHKSSPAQREEQLFTIVNHLNEGQALLIAAEREQLARLNLQAGRRAKTATAYSAALDYLRQGIALLPVNAWGQQYDLTLALHQEITEAAYLCTDFEQVEHWADLTTRHAYNLLDQLPVYEVRLLANRAQGNYLAAVRTGLQVLRILEVDFVEQPTPAEVQQTLADTRQLWAGQDPLSLLTLPRMTAVQRLAAMQIMTKLTAPAYRALPALLPMLMAKQVEFSIRFGNSPISIFAYAGYGMALCSMGEIEAGYGFGQLALRLLEQLQATTCESRAGYLVHNFICHWRDPLRQSLPAFVQAYQSGLATGDLECVVLNAQAYGHYAYFAGQPLADLAAEMAAYRQTLRQLKQVSLKCLEIVQQTVLNLLGEGEHPLCLSGSVYEAKSSVRFHLEHSDRTSLFHYHFNQTVLYYLFGQIEQAAQQADQVAIYLDGGRAQFPFALYAFYDALIQLARDQTAADHATRWQRIQQQQEKLAQWANSAPSNHRHRWQLVEAEIARVEGRYLEAMEAYDGAIASAKTHGFVQDEGLANELAARFYLAWGRDKLAQLYLHDAYDAYAHWGAKAKTQQLETLYPDVLQAASVLPAPGVLSTSDEISSRTSDTAALDLAAVVQASQAISQELRPDQLIVTLMQLVLENAGAERGALVLRQADQLVVVAQCLSGETCLVDLVPLQTSHRLPVSLIHFVDRTAVPLVIDDMRVEPRFAADPYLVQHLPKSVLGLPLIQKNQAMGVLYLENNLTTGAFTRDRIQVLDILCAQAAISFENANLYQNLEQSNRTLQQSLENLQKTQTQLVQATDKLQHDALYDGLTNLPNRACFLNLLNHAIHMSAQHPDRLYAVLFMDLDRFKNINDSLGHLIGDEFLKLASQRLQRCVGAADVVARFGGDEFAILLENLPHPDAALAIAQRIQDQFSLAFLVSDYEVFSTASTGITYSTLNYQVATHVLRDADIALYQAKAKGRNQYVVFDPAMQAQITQRLQLESDLRRAIEAQEFCLHYQPIVSLATGQVRGFEALVRWQHPTRGLISPLEFIPVAEETGLIGPIGWWVLETACQQLMHWQTVSQAVPLTMNVNLSAIQLKQAELIERLEAVLQATQIPRHCLKLEITESCILDTFTSEAQSLKRLKALGVRLCIDDFGTGYSSLSRLHEFPIDTLKIDRSFVQRLSPTGTDPQTSLETVQMILTLAHSLNIDVVAEGIETAAELDILKALGCESGQGYWFAPPLVTASAAQWLHPG
ncbi:MULTISPECIES: EAL domain-containing protein [Cyanophyceae]|uniref:EAL domain-containing protein n=1 Tax=Cyanophyceae TaxID=3028117 RepID=UPI0016852164|nr:MULTISPECIES: EAL domain-containing protein [Cyanophyceae]MBD1915322.1 EAL domain-containing protein [Phormidium sp. FACHB-77]MBD2032807.1 EAL domain-containing protein [Phormidium sp. FACHB-322]MBD2051842.1 EAL domain-containing protein [Leptolyngbya sp. FACHB-60]